MGSGGKLMGSLLLAVPRAPVPCAPVSAEAETPPPTSEFKDLCEESGGEPAFGGPGAQTPVQGTVVTRLTRWARTSLKRNFFFFFLVAYGAFSTFVTNFCSPSGLRRLLLPFRIQNHQS